MNGAIPNQQQYPTQPTEPKTPMPPPQSRQNKLGIAIPLIVLFLILLAVILNYFNILRLSEIFPNYLGFLPRRDVPTGTSQQPARNASQSDAGGSNNVTISPTEQAKQALTTFLPTVLTASFLPQSMSNVTIKSNETGKESYAASWRPKEGIVRIGIQGPLGSRKFNSIDLFYDKEIIQSPSPTVVIAKSEINQIFSVRSKGTWGCKNFTDTILYCENFWDESGDLRRGLGFLLTTTKTKGRVIYSFCEHSKESNLYSWKSCRAEFAKSGVSPVNTP